MNLPVVNKFNTCTVPLFFIRSAAVHIDPVNGVSETVFKRKCIKHGAGFNKKFCSPLADSENVFDGGAIQPCCRSRVKRPACPPRKPSDRLNVARTGIGFPFIAFD